MSKNVRTLDHSFVEELFKQCNCHRYDMTQLKAGAVFHADKSTAIATADASDLPTSIVLANALKASLNTHMASAISSTTAIGVHVAADSTNGPIATADATDLASVETLLNAAKTKFNAHLSQSGVHFTNDAATVATANATDQATSNTLANALKAAANLHYSKGFSSDALVKVGA